MNDSETASEKPKRGRPRRLSREGDDVMRSLYADKSERQRNNLAHAINAAQRLRHHPDYAGGAFLWLWNPGEDDLKHTILSELGRIEDDGEMVLVARDLCAMQPKTKDAVTIIRRLRLGEREPRPYQLQDELVATINDFWKRFPKTTRAEVLDALAFVRVVVRDDSSDAAAPAHPLKGTQGGGGRRKKGDVPTGEG